MILVPLTATAAQTVQIQLNGQTCQLNIYEKFYGLYMDVMVNNVLIIGGVACRNLNRIVRSLYLGFVGDFTFVDTQGEDDPDYTGLGAQFQLIYLTPDETIDLVQDAFGVPAIAG